MTLSDTLSLVVIQEPNAIKHGELSVFNAVITAKRQSLSVITAMVLRKLKLETDTCQELLKQVRFNMQLPRLFLINIFGQYS